MSGMEHIIYLFNFPHKATLPPLFDKPINWMSRRGIFHCTLSEIKSWNRQNWAHIKKRKLNKLDQKDGFCLFASNQEVQEENIFFWDTLYIIVGD